MPTEPPRRPPHDDGRPPGPSARRKTKKYQQKRRIVRDVWIVSGLLMLSVPTGMTFVLALGTTFVSFMILDETP